MAGGRDEGCLPVERVVMAVFRARLSSGRSRDHPPKHRNFSHIPAHRSSLFTPMGNSILGAVVGTILLPGVGTVIGAAAGAAIPGPSTTAPPPPPSPPPTKAELRQRARQQLGLAPGKVHVAVVGPTGVGKSSVINSIRGLRVGSPGYAMTGEVETTHSRTPYDWTEDIVLHDVPGGGTVAHPAHSYPHDIVLHGFDVVLSVYDRSIMSINVDIARRCAEWDQPCLLVRNKMDDAVAAVVRRDRCSVSAASASVRASVRADADTQVRSAWPAVLLYMVSTASWDAGRREWDESALLDAIRRHRK